MNILVVINNYIKKYFKRIKHVAEYLPLLWKDYHWDYQYLLDLIEFKLKKMEYTINKNDLIEDKDKVCKSMRVFRKLMVRSNDEEWHRKLQQMHLERQWGKAIWFEPSKIMNDLKQFEIKSKSGEVIGRKRVFINAPYEVITNDLYSVYMEDSRLHWKKSDKKQQKDLKLALKIFEKYHRTWWD